MHDYQQLIADRSADLAAWHRCENAGNSIMRLAAAMRQSDPADVQATWAALGAEVERRHQDALDLHDGIWIEAAITLARDREFQAGKRARAGILGARDVLRRQGVEVQLWTDSPLIKMVA